jgi:UDP-N-acetylmuramyl-tripeptide synthetase
MALTRLKSPEAAARWLKSWVTGTLRSDSRQVQPGDAFIAWPGHAVDGRRFVQAALDAGAATVLVEEEGIEHFGFENARIATLPKMKAATGRIASEFFDRPTDALAMVAVTGTNGKTSSTWWIAQALSLLGKEAGVVGTLGIGRPPLPARPGDIHFTGLTTPDPVMLHASLRRFADAAYGACAMEASSIGIVEHRIAGARFDVAVFTNFTRDHLDYHNTMDAYWAAKRELFDWPGLRAAVINIDDPQGEALSHELAGGTLEVWTCSTQRNARLRGSDLRYIEDGLAFTLAEGDAQATVRSTLIGDYNANNLLGVIGGLRALGVPLTDAVRTVPDLTPVPGRMQRVGHGGGPEVVVDYAHTPDALEKVIGALRPLAQARGGQLWCVFGCGGNRDATKRPLMGAIAARLADRVVATSDNPRDEEPAAILAQIAAGIGRDDALVIEDRGDAIRRVVKDAHPRDVILIAGKGHEDYQEVRGVKHPFSDAVEAQAALAQRSRP